MKVDNLEKYNKDFNEALNIYENEYSHDDLINLLKNGSIAQKQAAVIKLDNINDDSEAKVFMSNLTNCDGKIREAISFRLSEFVANKPELFVEYADIFLDAIIDINGNICRNTISAIKNLQGFPKFIQPFCEVLSKNALDLAKKAEKFDIQDGKYKINKEIFKLYWYLETIYEFFDYISPVDIEQILFFAKNVNDYTIREKVTKIITKTESFSNLKEELSKDENYYVRRILK